jgi:transcriptional regulator with XRE-family HTH domain
MSDDDIDDADTTSNELALFTRRFAVLYDTQKRPNGQPWTAKALAEALRRRGVRTTLSYVGQLRRGTKSNPSLAIVDGLAKVFSVPVAYFVDDDLADRYPVLADSRNAPQNAELNRMIDYFTQLSPTGRVEIVGAAKDRFRLEELERTVENADYDAARLNPVN